MPSVVVEGCGSFAVPSFHPVKSLRGLYLLRGKCYTPAGMSSAQLENMYGTQARRRTRSTEELGVGRIDGASLCNGLVSTVIIRKTVRLSRSTVRQRKMSPVEELSHST
jgi:hypothetical protein